MNEYLAELDRAAAAVRAKAPRAVDVAVVLGSGLGEALVPEGAVEVSYADLPGFPPSAVEGHAGRLLLGAVGGRGVAVLRGRAHYYEGHEMSRVVFAVRAMRRAGAAILILTNAVGSIRRAWRPGALVLVKDHINMMGANPLRGPAMADLGPRFPDLSKAYDPGLRATLKREARALRTPLPEGVYAAMSGPTYETPAEIRALKQLGADLVGMSVVPEAIAGVHAGLRVAAISCVANHAAGVARETLTHEDVIKAGAKLRERLGPLLRRAIPRL